MPRATSILPAQRDLRLRLRLHLCLALGLALAACGDERETSHSTETSSPAATAATSTTASGSGGAPGTGGAPGAGGEGGSGTSDVCRACWNGACADEADACLADETCSCVLGCDDDVACEASCGTSAAIDALRICIIEASVDECLAPCDAACEACVFAACRAELDACYEDTACLCAASCGGDADCEATCGASAVFDDFTACIAGLDPGTCGEACP